MILSDTKKYTVIKTLSETPGVVTLELSAEGRAPVFIAGQFLTVYLPELGTPEGKAYSISSAPGEPVRITVKSLGEFSQHLCSLKPGDTFSAAAPSGYFYSESAQSTLVMIAAGIGIAPFRSVMLDMLAKNPARPLKLFYSNRTMQDIVFDKELEQLAAEHPNVEVCHFITRQEAPPAKSLSIDISHGRISTDAVLRAIGDAPDPEFFICGSISFVRDLWRSLKSAGVPEDRLYTEAFFSH